MWMRHRILPGNSPDHSPRVHRPARLHVVAASVVEMSTQAWTPRSSRWRAPRRSGEKQNSWHVGDTPATRSEERELEFQKLGFQELEFQKLGFQKLEFQKLGFQKLGFHAKSEQEVQRDES